MNNLHIVPSIDFFNVLNFFYLTLIVRFFCTRGTDHGFVGDVKHPPPPPPPPPTPLKKRSTPFYSYNYIAPLLLILFCVNWLKKENFLRAIARIRMRPFELKSEEKCRIPHGRKVDCISCSFAALASLVQQTLHSVKIYYFTPV